MSLAPKFQLSGAEGPSNTGAERACRCEANIEPCKTYSTPFTALYVPTSCELPIVWTY